MKVIKYPTRDTWSEIVRRPYHDSDSIDPIVSQILDDVRARGDDAVRDYGRRFDGVELLDLEVSAPEFASAANDISDELKNAILVAKKNIETFHNVPFEDGREVETTDGVFCWRRRVAIHIEVEANASCPGSASCCRAPRRSPRDAPARAGPRAARCGRRRRRGRCR